VSTLYLSAPWDKTDPGTHRKDFYEILERRVGPDYAIYSGLIGLVRPGMRAEVFDKGRGKKAEGVVTKLVPKRRAGNGVQRYDVLLGELTEVPYTNPPQFNRCGIAVA